MTPHLFSARPRGHEKKKGSESEFDGEDGPPGKEIEAPCDGGEGNCFHSWKGESLMDLGRKKGNSEYSVRPRL